MPSPKRRTLLALFIALLIAFEMLVYVAITPRPGEQFFQFDVLGADRTTADYYPNGDSNIRLNESVLWYLDVTNFMGNVQLVVVRVKLGNQTIVPPDDLNATPSPAPLVTEFKRFMQNNETWQFPFVWQIEDAVTVNGSVRVVELWINNETFRVQGSSLGGRNFRLIFELWTLQADSGALQFGWDAGGERRVAWLQVWFNATQPMSA